MPPVTLSGCGYVFTGGPLKLRAVDLVCPTVVDSLPHTSCVWVRPPRGGGEPDPTQPNSVVNDHAEMVLLRLDTVACGVLRWSTYVVYWQVVTVSRKPNRMRSNGRVVASTLVILAGTVPPVAYGQQVAEVQLAPVAITLGVGERRELLASAYDARGDNLPTVTFVWTSTDPAVVLVEEDPSVPGVAILIGVGRGVASVEARVGGERASAAVQVVAPGAAGTPGAPAGGGVATVLQIEPGSVVLLPSEDSRLQPRFLDDEGALAAPTAVDWSSLTPGVAAISAAGVVVGLAPGHGVVQATAASGLQALVTVRVEQAAFGFTSEILAVSPGQSDTVRVTVPLQNDRFLPPRRLVWRSTDDAVARVSPVGVLTGVAAGKAEIIVTGFGQERRLPVTVHRRVESLLVIPKPSAGPVAIPLGGSRNFQATALDKDSIPVPQAPLAWRVPDTTVAVFDSATGALTGKALGETQLSVRAPGEGLKVTWSIRVIASGVSLDVDVVGMGLTDRRRIAASFTDEDGTPVGEATAVIWTSSDPGVLEVDEHGNVVPVAFGTALVVASTPWGSADSATFYVQGEILVTSTRGGNADVYAFDRDHPEQLNRVIGQPGSEMNALYSPDRTKIAYVSDRGGNLDIYTVDADGSNPIRLTSTLALEGSFSWTPDGRQIVYESDAGGTVQIWIMTADGSGQRQLTQGDSPNLQPAVSPNGRTIAFTSNRDGNYDIYLMDLDGSSQRSFTASGASETMPAWAGDSAIAYILEEGRRSNATRTVTQMNFSRETVALTPTLAVTDFAVSASGDLVAVIVSAQGPSGLQSRLYLIPVSGDGSPVEVPREGEGDQLITPSFRP